MVSLCPFQVPLKKFNRVQLLYNVVLVSAVQQSESATCIHGSSLFWISIPFRSPQSIPCAPSSYLLTKLLPKIHYLLFSFFSFNFCFQRSHSFFRFHCRHSERGQICVSLFLSFTTSPVTRWVFPPKCPVVSLNKDVKKPSFVFPHPQYPHFSL